MAVYFVMNEVTHDIKIGTSTDVVQRLRTLQTASAERLILLGSIQGGHAEERSLHARFARFRKKGGEWFVGDPMLTLKIGKLIGSDIVADEGVVLLPRERSGRGVRAVAWLTAKFRERREWFSSELRDAAAADGISKNALWSSHVTALPISKRPVLDPDGSHRWIWEAEAGWPSDVLENAS